MAITSAGWGCGADSCSDMVKFVGTHLAAELSVMRQESLKKLVLVTVACKWQTEHFLSSCVERVH